MDAMAETEGFWIVSSCQARRERVSRRYFSHIINDSFACTSLKLLRSYFIAFRKHEATT